MSLIDKIFKDIRELEEKLHWARHRHHHHYPGFAFKSLLNVQFSNFKISFMAGTLSVPSGTPVTGSASPLDAKGNVLQDSAFKTGSCKWGVQAGAGFTVAPGATEETFVVTETTPGTASTGTLTFDAQDVNGVQLPQSTATVSFTEAPAVAVGSQINFDQTSH